MNPYEIFISMSEFMDNTKTNEVPAIRELPDLPEHIAVVPRPELQPKIEIQETTEQRGKALEFFSRAKEVSLPAEPAYTYTDHEFTSNGRYLPAQISGIYEDALDDSECRSTMSALKEWQHQETEYTCAIQSFKMAINRLSQKAYSESDIRQEVMNHGWFKETEGVYPSDHKKIAELFGFEAKLYRNKLDVKALESLKEDGNGVLVSVDALKLNFPIVFHDKATINNHLVEFLGFDFTDKNNPLVLINDPGSDRGCGAAYPLAFFEQAACIEDFTGTRKLAHVTEIFSN